MDSTPKTRSKFHLKLKRSEIGKSPHHSTPEESTSKKTPESLSSEQFSPVNSPSRYERLSQDIQVFWGWKSPDEVSFKKTGMGTKNAFKADVTPSRIYSSPKPKRKSRCQKYSDKLQSLADELKSLTEGMNCSTLPGKSSTEECKDNTADGTSGEAFDGDMRGDPKQCDKDNVCFAEKLEPTTEAVKSDGGVPQDVFVVQLSPGGFTSLKSFPPGHQFPNVPKLDLETAMNSSDYTVLMADNSIEDEIMKFTQKVEEEFMSRNKMEGKIVSTPCRDGSTVVCAVNKKVDPITSPKTPSSASKLPKSPALSRRSLSLKKNSRSPVDRSLKLDETVSWESCSILACGKKLGSVLEEDVMGMLADDSFDNIMLEMVAQSEPIKQAAPFHQGKESVNGCSTSEGKAVQMVVQGEPKKQNASFLQDKENVIGISTSGGNANHSLKTEGDLKMGDSLGMLEDDSLTQPDVLNYLDSVENQAIAASQPLKCTPEEIKLKMMEAKKKLAVGKRKWRSQMKLNEKNPEIDTTSKSKY